MDRILELEKEIEEKRAELKRLRENRNFNFSSYNSFENEKYGSYSLGHNISAELRNLCVKLLSMEVKTRADHSEYITTKPRPKVKEMSQYEICLCNKFLEELYPLVEKYARIILSNKENE